MSDRMLVHLGGSWRKWKRQESELGKAGVALTFVNNAFKGHYSNSIYITDDTPETRALIKKVGGTVCRDQGAFSKKNGGSK